MWASPCSTMKRELPGQLQPHRSTGWPGSVWLGPSFDAVNADTSWIKYKIEVDSNQFLSVAEKWLLISLKHF